VCVEGGGESSSTAFGISVADRPKAKRGPEEKGGRSDGEAIEEDLRRRDRERSSKRSYDNKILQEKCPKRILNSQTRSIKRVQVLLNNALQQIIKEYIHVKDAYAFTSLLFDFVTTGLQTIQSLFNIHFNNASIMLQRCFMNRIITH
jgi:hypothetical protein